MNAKKQIFLLHFAGGSTYSYDFLKPFLQGYEFHPLELPGRGKRVTESFVNSIDAAINDYVQQILSLRNGAPFLVFGHSMGAMIGAYLTSELEKRKHFPVKFIAGGNPGPGCFVYKKRSALPDAEFLKELKDMGGMPEDFFKHKGLIDYFIPILKSDFKVLEDDEERPIPQLKTSIIAMMGDEEEKVGLIDNWSKLTTGECKTMVVKGSHFFILKMGAKISAIFKACF